MDLKTLKVLAFCALSPFAISAQIAENVDTLNVLEQRVTLAEDALFSLKKLKISGYLQPQFQSAQIDSMGSGLCMYYNISGNKGQPRIFCLLRMSNSPQWRAAAEPELWPVHKQPDRRKWHC